LPFSCGVALVIATLGGPLAGALGSYFWMTHVTDRISDDWAVAERLAQRVVPPGNGGGPIIELPEFFLHSRFADCSMTMASHGSVLDQELQPDLGIQAEIIAGWQDRHDAARNHIDEWALMRLPHAELGGLDGCVNASLLAPICIRYARDILEQAHVAGSAVIKDADARNYKRTEAEMCELASLLRSSENTARKHEK